MLIKLCARMACALAFLFLIGSSGTSQIASHDRFSRTIDPYHFSAVKGSAHPLARPQDDLGRTDPTRPISGTLTFRLSPVQQADLDRLLRDQQNPASPRYHNWITPEQYAQRFGLTHNDLTKVVSWLQSQGLRYDGVSRGGTEVSFSGSVGQVEYAMHTQIHNYLVRGEQHFANSAAVGLPSALAEQVLNVRGLNDFRPKARARLAPRFTSNISGNHFLIPGDFNTIYDIPASRTGSGQKIAVVGQTNITMSDIDTFRSNSGLATNSPTVTLVPSSGTLTISSGDELEADLDLEWSGAIAPAAKIIFVTVGNSPLKNVFDSLQYAIDNNVAPVVSISYGNCEANLSSSFVLSVQQWAQQANAQGQTISGPSGDQGAADCESATATSATHGLAVDVPAAVPEVTGVGGSEFSGDAGACPNQTCSGNVAPATQYWSGSSTATSGASALSYIPEKVWNDTTAGQSLSAGGGGLSKVFGKPSWQTGSGVPADGARDVPDITVSGSNGHDPYLVCNAGSCTNGFRDGSNNLTAVGGTSAGAPTFAAIVALINQATGSNGLGNVNPMLYALAANNSTNHAFHDITSGDNKVPCTAGSSGCPTGTTSIGISAGADYDAVTGLGSPDVGNLIQAWLAASPSADFVLEGTSSTVGLPGQKGTSTITVSRRNGFSGVVSLSCNPSSSANITCSLNPNSVDLTSSASGTATLSLTTVAGLRTPNLERHPFLWMNATGGLLAVVLLGGGKRHRWTVLLALVLAAVVLLGVGCGGGGSSAQQKSQSTPAGTYAITVTGTSGSTSHTATVNLTVQ
jgi:subtilase family serine protease